MSIEAILIYLLGMWLVVTNGDHVVDLVPDWLYVLGIIFWPVGVSLYIAVGAAATAWEYLVMFRNWLRRRLN